MNTPVKRDVKLIPPQTPCYVGPAIHIVPGGDSGIGDEIAAADTHICSRKGLS